MNAYYITGTSRGIGKALATALVESVSSIVTGIGRTSSIEHNRYLHHFLDLANLDEVRNFKFNIPEKAQRVVLINNAGTVSPIAPLGRLQNRSIIEALNLNLLSPVILMNTFLSQVHAFRGGKIIINVSSGAGRHPIDSWSTYSSAKAGLDMASQVTAKEQNLHNPDNPASIFSVAPGVVDTEMQKEIRSAAKKDFNGVDRFITLKRDDQLMAPETVAQHFIKIIENPGKFPKVCMDIRNLQ